MVDIWVTLGTIATAIITFFPILKRYIKKLINILTLISKLIGDLMVLESIQKTFLENVITILEDPDKLSTRIPVLKELIEEKKGKYEEFVETLNTLIEMI